MPQTATVVCHPEARDVAQPKRRVLLVDDNDSLRKMLTLVLKNNGFEVAAASNVNDALKLIAAETFDVLLSDLHMPDASDGLTVVSAMRHSNSKAVIRQWTTLPRHYYCKQMRFSSSLCHLRCW